MLHKQYLLSELFVLENSQSTRKPLHPPPLKTKSRLKREGAYVYLWLLYGSSVQFSCSVMSDSLRPHGLRHARPPCPSPTPGVCPSPTSQPWENISNFSQFFRAFITQRVEKHCYTFLFFKLINLSLAVLGLHCCAVIPWLRQARAAL